MKVYILTKIDIDHSGISPEEVVVSTSKEKLNRQMREEYLAKCAENGYTTGGYDVLERTEDWFGFHAGYYAYVADNYYWDIYESELDD